MGDTNGEKRLRGWCSAVERGTVMVFKRSGLATSCRGGVKDWSREACLALNGLLQPGSSASYGGFGDRGREAAGERYCREGTA